MDYAKVYHTLLLLTTQSTGGAKHLSSRGSEMSFPPFFGRFQMSISTIETDPDHPRQLLPAMTAVTNQLVCIYIDCWVVLNF